jgi:TolA-binding protein
MKKSTIAIIVVAVCVIIGVFAYAFLSEKSRKIRALDELDRSLDLAEDGIDELEDASEDLNELISKGIIRKFEEREERFEIEDSIKAGNNYCERALRIAKRQVDSEYEDVSMNAEDLVDAIEKGIKAASHFDNAYNYLMKNNFRSARSELTQGRDKLMDARISLDELEHSIERIE